MKKFKFSLEKLLNFKKIKETKALLEFNLLSQSYEKNLKIKNLINKKIEFSKKNLENLKLSIININLIHIQELYIESLELKYKKIDKIIIDIKKNLLKIEKNYFSLKKESNQLKKIKEKEIIFFKKELEKKNQKKVDDFITINSNLKSF